MDVLITPTPLKGTIKVPASKSILHRAIIAASIANGTSIIRNINYSDDILRTIEAMKSLGVVFTSENDTLTIVGNDRFELSNNLIDCHESGSTLRFLIPLLSLASEAVTFTGRESLMRRPLALYKSIFTKHKSTFKHNKNNVFIEGSLRPGKYVVPGNISSQFITGLLLTLPLLSKSSKIIVTDKFESKPYVDLTVDVLSKFGIKIVVEDNIYYIKGKQAYEPADIRIEGDYSQAAFFLTMGLFNEEINVVNLDHDSKQGDQAIVSIIEDFGGTIEQIEGGYQVRRSSLHATMVDIGQCPDLGPITTAIASLADGTTDIKNAGRLRIKESDRLEAIQTAINELGGFVLSDADTLTIVGKPKLDGDGDIDSFNDHRIVMSVASIASMCKKPFIIRGADSINKSYPSFFDDFLSIGGDVKYISGDSDE
jgi:3-phosphoshikimate 1-carboxyvinyltransferase